MLGFFLDPFDPGARARHEHAVFEREHERPVAWPDYKPTGNEYTVLSAASWREHTDGLNPFPVKPAFDRKVKRWDRVHDDDIRAGNVVYRNQILFAGDWLAVWNGRRQRRSVAFDQDVIIPTLYRAHEDRVRRVWMSVTPMEVLTARGGVRRAKGRVLVAGLGLGMLVRQILAKRTVKHVTVVELSSHVLKLIAPTLPSGVEVVEADAYKYIADHAGEYDRILVDIWSDYGDSQDDYKLAAATHGHGHKLWCWGGNPR